MKKRILFICETVTMAHITRSASLASALPKEKFEIHFAAGEVPASVANQVNEFKMHPLPSAVSSSDFLAALKVGKLPYSQNIIQSQVQEDLDLINTVRPDLIIGDFRLSLLISARVARVPFVNITNLTWHPSAKLGVQVPDIPITGLLGVRLTGLIFRHLKPFIYASLAKPFNKIASNYGLPSLGSLEEIYTSGDHVFYADVPGIVETAPLPKGHHVAGPVPGRLQVELAKEISGWLDERPLILVSLGSSGPQHLLPLITKALENLPAQALVSTSGLKIDRVPGPNIRVVDFMPLDVLLPKASALLCNGGSPSCYSAAAGGVPVLAIPSNLDQFNCSEAFVQKGMALRLRPKEVNARSINASLSRLLNEELFRVNAKQMQELLSRYNAKEYFHNLVAEILST